MAAMASHRAASSSSSSAFLGDPLRSGIRHHQGSCCFVSGGDKTTITTTTTARITASLDTESTAVRKDGANGGRGLVGIDEVMVNPVGLGRRSRQVFDEVWRKFSRLGQMSATVAPEQQEEGGILFLRGSGPMCEFAVPGAQDTTVLVVGATSRIGRIVVCKLMLRGYNVKVSLYVLDPIISDDRCFESLVYNHRASHPDWHWQSLPPPPYKPTSSSFILHGEDDAAMIWVSTDNGATYSFDTARRAWAKQGDWTLPFRGLADYVPDYNLWFALNAAGRLCAFDLAKSSPPVRPRNVWPEEVKTPNEWMPVTSYLVHLGSGRFCVARFFDNKVKIPGGCCCDMETDTETHAVFTGVEVEPCGKAGGGLRMVKHRSECYRLVDILQQWVL